MKVYHLRKRRRKPLHHEIDVILGFPVGTVEPHRRGGNIWYTWPKDITLTEEQKTAIDQLIEAEENKPATFERVEFDIGWWNQITIK